MVNYEEIFQAIEDYVIQLGQKYNCEVDLKNLDQIRIQFGVVEKTDQSFRKVFNEFVKNRECKLGKHSLQRCFKDYVEKIKDQDALDMITVAVFHMIIVSDRSYRFSQRIIELQTQNNELFEELYKLTKKV